MPTTLTVTVTDEATSDCTDCGGLVPATEIRDCDNCGRRICEDCTDRCTGVAGNTCRTCHLARCTSRDCWE